jgi:hypothetical protein
MFTAASSLLACKNTPLTSGSRLARYSISSVYGAMG